MQIDINCPSTCLLLYQAITAAGLHDMPANTDCLLLLHAGSDNPERMKESETVKSPRSPRIRLQKCQDCMEKQADQKGLIVFLLSSQDKQIMSHFGGDFELRPEANWPRLVGRSIDFRLQNGCHWLHHWILALGVGSCAIFVVAALQEKRNSLASQAGAHTHRRHAIAIIGCIKFAHAADERS